MFFNTHKNHIWTLHQQYLSWTSASDALIFNECNTIWWKWYGYHIDDWKISAALCQATTPLCEWEMFENERWFDCDGIVRYRHFQFYWILLDQYSVDKLLSFSTEHFHSFIKRLSNTNLGLKSIDSPFEERKRETLREYSLLSKSLSAIYVTCHIFSRYT